AAMAVAVLTKGLIGIVLPGLVLIVYTAVARDFAIWRRLHLVGGALVAFAIAVPWFVLVSQRNPEFASFFFIHEHWQRYVSTVHHRVGAWWYFIPQLVVGFLPWLGLSRRMVVEVRADLHRPGFRPLVLLASWALTIFVFFSFSSSKLPGYIVPIYPALAILAAVALDRVDARHWRFHVAVALALSVVAFAAAPFFSRLGGASATNTLYRAFEPWFEATCLIAIFGLLGAWLLSGRDPRRSIVAYALTLFAASTLALRGHEVFGRSSSGVDLVAAMEAQLADTTPIYSVRLLDHTLPFYLRRTMVMVEAPGELEFGVQQEPQKWLPTLDAFVAAWSAPPHALAVMSHPTFAVLQARGVPMTVVAEDARRVVVANSRSSPP
ncbi:MAG TPA: 4-amino-4-deoxy-L-arabinose transferase, partial [Caldimonas sp.]|nr:4-amino-4-deoxy-L-arabinose transferase [Caldimonas sp.]